MQESVPIRGNCAGRLASLSASDQAAPTDDSAEAVIDLSSFEEVGIAAPVALLLYWW